MVIGDSPSSEEYFVERGFEFVMEERDLHAEHMARGEGGRASFFVEGRRYFCVQLLCNGSVVARDYAHGETPEAAIEAARRRFRS